MVKTGFCEGEKSLPTDDGSTDEVGETDNNESDDPSDNSEITEVDDTTTEEVDKETNDSPTTKNEEGLSHWLVGVLIGLFWLFVLGTAGIIYCIKKDVCVQIHKDD